MMAACAAAMACACAASADAGVIFQSVPDLTAAPLGDWDASSPVSVAGSFSLSAAETIRSVEFVADLSSDVSLEGVTFLSDDHGNPGGVLFGTSGYGPYISSSVTGAHTRLFSVSIDAFTLNPGTYWLGLTSDSAGIEGFSGSGSTVQCDVNQNTGAWNPCTPNNQTLGFALIGDAADGTPPGPSVPEPSVWAMLLIGLFFLGSALRLQPCLVEVR